MSKACNRYLLRIFSLLQKNDIDKYSTLISKIIYSMFLHVLYKNNNSFTGDISDQKSAFVQKLAGYIDDHLHENLSVEKLSKICSFNPHYFARLFHRVMGMTSAKYILEKRISKAKELIAGSDIPIELISDRLGFCNASHFIRLFKRTEGLTPAVYRRQCLLLRLYKS